MQVVYKNKNKGKSSRRVDSIDTIIYARKLSRYMKREYLRSFRSRSFRI